MSFNPILILLLLPVLLVSCFDPETNYPEKLKVIPNGITVTHSKNVVYAELNQKDPDKYGKYKWHFETSVTSQSEELEIIEFGAYIWNDGKWEFGSIYDRPFNPEEFSRWYSCPSGEIKKGQTYTDPNNWSKGGRLDGEETKNLWYFIGINDEGEKFKGTAQITIVGELGK